MKLKVNAVEESNIRFFDVKISNRTRLDLALMKIYGVSKSTAMEICGNAGMLPRAPIALASDEDLNNLATVMKAYTFGGTLQAQLREQAVNGLRSREERYIRQKAGLPSRGQRTRTNGKTAKRLNKKRFARR